MLELMKKNEKVFVEFQKIINYKFKNKKILVSALTHKSYIGMFKIQHWVGDRNNERLEFLGDSVLGYIVTDYVYKKFKGLKEGELSEIRSHIVCKASLSKVAKSFEMYKYLIYGNGITEQEIKVNDSVLENTMEAVVGAIYLDGGIKPADKFVKKFIIPEDSELQLKSLKDSKSRLQEILQSVGNASIEYKLISTSGPDHDKSFEVEVFNNNKKLGHGVGKNKKIAEQNAAKEALLSLNIKDNT